MTATLDSMAAPQAPAAGSFGRRLIPDGDPLAGQAFEAIYEARIKPELVKCEAQRQRALWLFIAGLALAVALVVGEFLITPVITGTPGALPNWVVVLITLGVVGFCAYLPLSGVGTGAKVAVIQALCQPLGVSYALDTDEGPSYPTFLSLHLLPKPTSVSFEDLFSGRRGDVDFALCGARLMEGSGRDQRVAFIGQLIRLVTPRRLGSTTVVLRNSGWVTRFQCPPGLQPVGLEDPAFDKTFAVFGADQVEAREVMTPAFMQQLSDFEAAYAGNQIRCAFETGELLIALEGHARFGIGSLFTSLVNRARVEGIARDLEQVFTLIDHFRDA